MAGTVDAIIAKAGAYGLFSCKGLVTLLAGAIAIQVLHTLVSAIYNVYFHPLRRFPGPKSWIAFDIARTVSRMRGYYDLEIRKQHLKYGEVVRIGKNELSFVHPDAWKDIYGHGHAELPKYFPPNTINPMQLVAAPGNNHFRMRRAMLPAFSDKALAQQESLIRVYVDLLMERLTEAARSGAATNMTRWYNLATFDLIADLCYGKSLQGLASGKSNRWIDKIETMMKVMPTLLLITSSPIFGTLFNLAFGSKLKKSREEHQEYAASLAMDRIQGKEQADRGDFMDYMLRSRGQAHQLTDPELIANSDLIMIAGSETTATLLCAVTYWLLKTPDVYKKATAEVRAAFARCEDITFKEASVRLPYTLACLNEALRIFPSIPLALLRQTLPGAPTSIAGHLIPPQTRVGVHQLAAFHSPLNFHDSQSFRPERWLPDVYSDPTSPFHNDRREAHKPFSFGPRDCIGRNLAFHEMRLILATVLWKFDMKLGSGMETWHDQKIYALWTKPPLMIEIRERKM
ncbi:cytochrome P450 [Corynespora cassiicola Philippines]|uniref:Cytochrome P450 n=1 Tax=Corynespora cassiicola Philippines TaxID=1448308 RepID=A0A2T2NYM8_CORCC|nr:cytochrome P450 [Corynespora cassiicola Philippines]